MNLYGSLSVYSTDTFSEHYSQTRSSLATPININGNISYDGILKHRKYRCDSLVYFLFYLSWIMTMPVNHFHSKSFYVLRDIIIYHLMFLWFLFNVVFLTTIFPSQLDLLILQTTLLSHWSLPPILVDTISREVTRIKTYF
jgi:hypothetical protein